MITLGKKNLKFSTYILILVLIIVGIGFVISGVNNKKEVFELDKKSFLETKSTSDYDLGCGPPDDFDCGLNRYSGYMALSNIQAYEDTKDENFLDYAIKFAMTPQTSPPDWCVDCTCLPPDDFDCGTGEVQNEMIRVFAKLYVLTGNELYLEYSEEFVNTKPTSERESCTGCLCGPPDDFDCGETYVQSGFFTAYETLYQITGDEKYYTYMKNLADAWFDKSSDEKGPGLISLLLRTYQLTGESKYLDRSEAILSELIGENCGEVEVKWEKWRNLDFDESAFLDLFSHAYDATKDERYLTCSKTLIVNGNGECSDFVCASITQQASLIRALTRLYLISEDKEFLSLAEEYAKKENIESVNSNFFGYETQCENYDCHDAEDNAFISSALMELEKAKN